MIDFTTELASALTKGTDLKEFFRHHLESAINQLLEHELTIFFDYEK